MSHNLPHTQSESSPAAGALFVVTASLLFVCLGALVKIAATSLSNELLVFFRNIAAMVLFLPLFLGRHRRNTLKTRHIFLHLLRTATGLGAMYCFFFALAHMPLAEAVLLSFTSPLFIPIYASIWLKEPVPWRARGAILIGFVGVLCILKPGFGVFRPISLVGLTAGMLVGLAMVTVRRLTATEPVTRIVFYFTLLSTLISTVPMAWAWQVPRGQVWWLLAAIGPIAVVGQLLLTKGYSLAPASQVGPVAYAQVVFATIIGWLFWQESLDAATCIGAVLICLAGILTSYRSRTPAAPAVPGNTPVLPAESGVGSKQ
jgi:drug/metabolite transporter (DMT)-like permease